MSEGKIGKKPVVGGPVMVDGQEAKAVKKKAKPAAIVQAELRAVTKEEIIKLGGGQVKERPVRVRFAPSPTGHLHVGGARTALMNFLFAKKMGGEFVLRIEDTDQMRSKPEFTEGILDSLKMLGMNWDGDLVFQSQRSDLYNGAIDKLLAEGKAYLDPQGSGAVFFKMPPEATLYVPDRIWGNVPINVANADGNSDYVIRRSDGSPTFLFANVFDDGDQGITHILRGSDHLSNAARQIPLFRALGFEVPEFFHMPLIHGDPEPDAEGKMKGAGKLSKRHGAVWVGDYINLGYSPTVLMNHFARMGMSYDTDQTLPIEDIAKQFNPINMSKSPSLLGIDSLNKRMMFTISKMPIKELVAELKRRIEDEEQLKAHIEDPGTEKRPGFFERLAITANEAREILKGVDDRILEAVADGAKKRADNFGEMLDILFLFRAAPPERRPEDQENYATPKLKKLMSKLRVQLEKLPEKDWTVEKLDGELRKFNEVNDVKYGEYGPGLRWMLTALINEQTGKPDGLPLHNTLGVLGRKIALERLQEMAG